MFTIQTKTWNELEKFPYEKDSIEIKTLSLSFDTCIIVVINDSPGCSEQISVPMEYSSSFSALL